MPAVIEQALAAGKHVLSEKPVAPDVATGRRLLAHHARYPNLVWMVGENWRYEEAFLRAADLVQTGAIGEPLTCHWAFYTPMTARSKYYHTAWRRDRSFPGGFVLDAGVHHVAMLRLLLGEIVEVSATAHHSTPDLPPPDTLAATLRFARGVVGAYLTTFVAGAPWPPFLSLVGTQGTLRVQRKEVELTRGGQTEQITCSGFDGVEKAWVAFAQSVRQGAAHRNPPAETLQDLAVMEAMLASAAAGRPVAPERIVPR
jgi:predicted dehydrogenase